MKSRIWSLVLGGVLASWLTGCQSSNVSPGASLGGVADGSLGSNPKPTATPTPPPSASPTPSASPNGNSFYISQSGTGSGTSCSSALPMSWFNNSANWGSGSGKIGSGSTVYLCGTITTSLSFSGSGASGNPITVICASGGCDLTQPAGNLVSLNGQSNIILDGGFPCGPSVNSSTCTGIMQNTANGSGLANQSSTQAIYGNGASNIEIRNWLFANLYQHTSVSDSTIDQTLSCVFYANGIGNSFSFHDNTVHDVGWAVEFEAYSGTTTINVYNNYFYNYDHGVAVGSPASEYATVEIHDNHFGSTANWDTTNDAYHHDGTHFYAGTTWNPSWQFYVFNNLFDGNWGTDNTSQIFNEEGPPNMMVFNNVHIQYAGDYMNNGLANMGTSTGSATYNNTYVGVNLNLAIGIMVSGTNYTLENNVLTGFNSFVSLMSGNFASGGLNNNIYASDVGGGNTPFNYDGTSVGTFANWQSKTEGDSASSYISSAGLSSTGVPQSGSVAIGAGKNLTSLCTGIMTALCSTTTAGGTITPVPRPKTGAWNAGAY